MADRISIRSVACGALLGLTIGITSTVSAATSPGYTGPRFSPYVQSLLNHRHCPEDAYRVVTAAHSFPTFTPYDHLRILCITRDSAVPATYYP